MRHRLPRERRCTYVVRLENHYEDLHELATYLSRLAVCDFEIIVVDASPDAEENRRVLRWVGKHVLGALDPIRIALDLASCEKVIVADAHVRYTDQTLDHICDLLDLHEVVEPQDYFDPLPWWGGIEAGRILVHRGIGPLADHGSTFGFRKRALRGLRALNTSADDWVRRLASQGAEVFSAAEIFVRRLPPLLEEWLRDRPRHAGDDIAVPFKAAFFFALLPVTVLLAFLGNSGMAFSYLGLIAFSSLALAIRGRIGAAPFFPLRACLYAPLWLLERSIAVYWALFRKVSGTSEPPKIPIAVRTSGERVATGK